MELCPHQIVSSGYRNALFQVQDAEPIVSPGKRDRALCFGFCSVHELVINDLKAIKGIGLITAVGLVAEVSVSKFSRFKRPAQGLSTLQTF